MPFSPYSEPIVIPELEIRNAVLPAWGAAIEAYVRKHPLMLMAPREPERPRLLWELLEDDTRDIT